MSAAVDSFTAKTTPFSVPHRKPLPPSTASAAKSGEIHSSLQVVNPDSRIRTPSSNILPPQPSAAPPAPPNSTQAYHNTQQPGMHQFIQGQPARRTLSNATSSTTSSNNGAMAAMKPVRTPSALRRSPTNSLTSVPAPTSYVALMRKQKATVWSERAQHEDPRLLAAQRQAKMRAAQEVVGGPASSYYGQRRAGGVTQSSHSSSGTFAGGVRSKIRHHGAQKAVSYKAGPGVGVPMRLSANEVDEGESDDDQHFVGGGPWHRRTGSGRSSLGSERRFTGSGSLQPLQSRPQQQHNASGGTGSNGPGSPNSPLGEEPAQYFGAGGPNNQAGLNKTATTTTMTSSSSGGSRENSFGQLGAIPQREPTTAAETDGKRKSTAEDLMRRGSVDERTMTMSGVRLFVANPDLSD